MVEKYERCHICFSIYLEKSPEVCTLSAGYLPPWVQREENKRERKREKDKGMESKNAK